VIHSQGHDQEEGFLGSAGALPYRTNINFGSAATSPYRELGFWTFLPVLGHRAVKMSKKVTEMANRVPQ
jgi:hypothetical protein